MECVEFASSFVLRRVAEEGAKPYQGCVSSEESATAADGSATDAVRMENKEG